MSRRRLTESSPLAGGLLRTITAAALIVTSAVPAAAVGDPICVSYWYVSYGGNSSYVLLNTDPDALTVDQLRFSRSYNDPTDLSKGYLDFDRDGKSDVFSAVPIAGGDYQWRYSAGGASPWIDLAFDATPPDQLQFGDFNGDGHTDVFSLTPILGGAAFQWRYSSGGSSSYVETVPGHDASGDFVQQLPHDVAPLGFLRFGDFNGDGRTDVFTLNGLIDGSSGWDVVYIGATRTADYVQINSATTSLDDMQFGDINHDGHTDVFTTVPGSVAGTFDWLVSFSGTGAYQRIVTTPRSVHDVLLAGNFDAPSDPSLGGTDAFYTTPRPDGAYQWWYTHFSANLQEIGDVPLAYDTTPPDQLRFGDFDGDEVTDVLKVSRQCTVTTKSKCDAAKFQCVAKRQACLLAAHAKAEKKGVSVDAAALAKCRDAFDGGAKGLAAGCIGKAEAKEDPQKPDTICTVKGDVTALADAVETFVGDAVRSVDPSFPVVQPPDDCNAAKKSCIAKRATCVLRAETSAAKNGGSVDPAAIQKCNAAFDGGAKGAAAGCIGKLDAKQKAIKPKTICAVTDGVAALERRIDVFVGDVTRATRLPPP